MGLIQDPIYLGIDHFKVGEVSRKLLEEEEMCSSVANSIKKYETDAKKISEEIQNMELK